MEDSDDVARPKYTLDILREEQAHPNPRTPLASEYGTCKTVRARCWPRFSGKSPQNVVRCSFLDGAEASDGAASPNHPGGNPGANLKSISNRCHPILVAFVWELNKETINFPLGCLQGGAPSTFSARSKRAPTLGEEGTA